MLQLDTEFIIDSGHGEGFCIGNIMKYAQRYGKKGGKNRADLLKVLHYALFMLNVHDKAMLSKSEVSDDIKSIEVFSAGAFSVKLSIMVNGVVILQDKLSLLDRFAKTFFLKK